MQGHNLRIRGKTQEKIGRGRADITYHDTGHQKSGHLPHTLRYREQDAERYQRTQKGSEHQRKGTECPVLCHEQHHAERYRKTRARGDTEHKGTGNGVRKIGLQEKARDRKRSAEEQCHQCARQTYLE